VWKGTAEATVRVFEFQSPPQGVGYMFERGREYVVYTGGYVPDQWIPIEFVGAGGPVYDLGTCSVRIRTDVARESKLLGQGQEPTRSRTAKQEREGK
jgi:hypothetical protein